MNDDVAESFDEVYASLIAACDEALAASSPPEAGSGASVPPPELRSQVQDALACIRRLRQHWPRQRAETLAQAPAGAELPATELIGRFQIRHELGRGSFGRVFLAYDPLLAREVALKVPRAEALVSAELRERFRREAQAAAGPDHPHIVPVHEAGGGRGGWFIAPPSSPGAPLGGWLR